MPKLTLVAFVTAPILVTACGLIPIPGMGGPGSSGGSSQRSAEVSESGPGPQTALDYAANAQANRCASSCYKPEPADAMAPAVKGCGYARWVGNQPKLGEHAWAKFSASQLTFADNGAIPFPCDQFPAPQAAWKKEIDEFRTKVDHLGPQDVVVAEPDADWEYQTNDHDVVVGRALAFRVYQHDVDTRANPCAGSKDPLTFCEKGRSQVATAMNAAAYHLDEAARFHTAGKTNACRQAAWTAVAYVESAKQSRTDGLARHQWTPGAKYELRDGKTLAEPALFAALDAAEARGTELFHACGGTGEPPLRADDHYLAVQALKSQPERGPDGVVRNHSW